MVYIWHTKYHKFINTIKTYVRKKKVSKLKPSPSSCIIRRQTITTQPIKTHVLFYEAHLQFKALD